MDKKSKTNQEIEDNSKIKQKSKSTPNKKLNKKAISYIMLASLWAGSGFGWFLYYYNHQKSVPVLRKGYEEQYYKELEKWLTPQQRKQREEFLKQAKEYEKQLKLEKEKRLEYASRHLVKFINDFDLGAINDNKNETIIWILEKKFEQVKGQIRVDETFKTKEYARIIPIKNSKYHGEVTVNFTVKTKLDTVITNKHLDKFDNPDEQQIINKVNELNKGLNLTNTDVEVEIKTDENKAIIKAKDSSSKYQGQVEVTYNIRPKIADKISTTSLGALFNNDINSILNAINKANENLNLTLDQVDIIKINDTSAIVKAKENNNYQGEVTVNFAVKKQLEQEATQLNLGALFNKDEQSIFEAFKKKNNNVTLEQKDVDINVQHNKATITVKPTNNDYQGQVEVKFTVKTKLDTVITNKHLDKFNNPDEQQIINKVNELNKGLNLTNTDVEVEIKTDENKAIIKAKDSSSKYQGQVEVTYNIRPKIADKISTTSLGALFNNDINSILNAINKANENLNLTLDQVDIIKINDTSAIVKAKENNNYQGEVTVNFAVKKQLEQEATQLNLGALFNKDEQSIFEAFKKKNNNVTLEQKDVDINVQHNKATITVKPTNNDYQGQVEVKFTVKTKLDTVITNKHLDKFNNPDEQQIINKVNELNKGLNLTNTDVEVEIKTDENKAIIKAKDSSSKYQGQVEVTYNIRPKIADKISTTSLGALFNNDINSILNAINKANENLNLTLDQVDIIKINDTSAIVKAKENNNYQGEVTVNFAVKKQLEQEATQLNLGALFNKDEQSIFEAFKKKNNNVTLEQKDVDINVQHNKATITVKPTNNDYQGQVEVKFTVKTKLDTVITNKHLDKFNNPDEQQIINKVNELNKGLNLTNTDVEVEIKTDENKAIIKAKDSSSKYQGQVEVTYNIRPKIADKISTTSLGALFNNDINSILNAINKANENLNLTLDQVDIIKINDTSAIVKAKENNNYQGEVTVNFAVKKQLEQEATQLNLGALFNKDEQSIFEAFKKKNNNVTLEQKDVDINVQHNKATITVKPTNNDYQGQVEVKFTVKTKLDTVITNKHLDKFDNPDEQQIINKVNELNKGLNLTNTDVEVEIKTDENKAIIKAKDSSSKYQGQVEVTYNIRPKIADKISTTSLGALFNNDINSILNAINKANENLNLTLDQVDIIKINDTSAIVKAKENNNYQGEVTVNFAVKKQLEQEATQLNLGALFNKDEQSIFEAFKKKNNNVTLEQKDVDINVQHNKATITVKPTNNDYQGQVEVKFTVKTKLDTVITNKHLDKFNNPDEQQIINKVNELNKGLNLTNTDVEVEIKTDENKAIIKAKDSSSKYQGQVEVTYNIRPKIADKISTTSLGALFNNDINSILNAINKINDIQLTFEQVDIESINDTSAIVKSKPNNDYQGQVTVTFTVKKQLGQEAKQLNLGALFNKDEKSIFEAFKRLNNSVNLEQNDVTVEVKKDNATITVKPTNNDYQGKVEVTFTIKTKLQDIIRNTDLGYIKEENFGSILKAINEKNPGINLTSSDIAWHSLQTGQQVKIFPETNSEWNPSNKYQGEVIVTFKIKEKLQEIIKNTDLGYIKEENFNSILKAINEKNPGINLTSSDIAWQSLQTGQQVKIFPETNSKWNPSNKYQGEIIVTYNTKAPWKEQPHKYDGTKVTEIGWTTLDDGTVEIEPFKENTTEVPAYLPPFITSLSAAFWGLESRSVKNLDKWDTSNITDMWSMFSRAKNFNQDISSWKTSKFKNMGFMFKGAESFNQPIGNWDISNVTNMEGMFYGANAFDQDISNWNVGNVTKWDYFNWNYGNYYRKWQIPPKFR